MCRGGAFLFRAAAGISQLELLLLRCQGGWEDDARGSQALPAKPLTKGIILGEGEQPPLPPAPVISVPRASGLLLTSHQNLEPLATDSSKGNEGARGPGSESRVLHESLWNQLRILCWPGSHLSALGKSCL